MSSPDWKAVEPQPTYPHDKRIAPVGQIWVCAACGKTSRDQYGDKGTRWDESCVLNSVLCWAPNRAERRARS